MPKKKQFEWLTLGAARNIQKILVELTPNEKNDKVAEQLRDFMDKYEKWLGNPPKNLEGIKSSIDGVLEAAVQIEYRNREEIAEIISSGVNKYMRRSRYNKIAQEKIGAPECGKKNIGESRKVKYWSFVENKNTKNFAISERELNSD